MKLSDLKTGMRVRLREQNYFKIIIIIDDLKSNGFAIDSDNGFVRLGFYSENFKNVKGGFKDLDIVEVYDVPEYLHYIFDFNRVGKLLWSEKQEIEEIKSE